MYYLYYFLGSHRSGTSETDDNDDNGSESEDSKVEAALIQSTSQIGSGFKRKRSKTNESHENYEDDNFISKVAKLVAERFNPIPTPRPVNTTWSNFNLSPPATSVLGNVNTTPPLHYNQQLTKNDFNDAFGKIKINFIIFF